MPPKVMKRPAAADDAAAAADEALENKKGKRSKKSPVSPTWTHGKLSYSEPADILSNILDRIGRTVSRDLKVLSTFQGLSPFASFCGKGPGIKHVCTAVDGKRAPYALLQRSRAMHIFGKLDDIGHTECLKHGKVCVPELDDIDLVMCAGDVACVLDAAPCLGVGGWGGSVIDLRVGRRSVIFGVVGGGGERRGRYDLGGVGEQLIFGGDGWAVIEAACFKKVKPSVGVFVIPTGYEDLVDMLDQLRGNHGGVEYMKYVTHAAFGKYGSPIHGNATVVFITRRELIHPDDIFSPVFTKSCTHAATALATVSEDLRRGWTELASTGKGDAVDDAEVNEILKGMVEGGFLPSQFARLGLTGGKPIFARSSLAVARLEALQWWMADQGKDFGIVNITGKDNMVYLDGSFPKIGKNATMAIARKDTTGVSFRALTNIDTLAILGYNVKAYNISVSTHAITSQTLASSIPVPVAFAVVMAVASALLPNGDEAAMPGL